MAMRINDSIISAAITVDLRAPVPVLHTPVSVFQDVVEISDETRLKIDQLQQGDQALRQALIQTRQASRSAAQERVSAAKEYLKLLARMSPEGDHGAAAEAARVAREIKGATVEFRAHSGGSGTNVSRAEIAGFAGVAGDALKIAYGLVERYLRKHPSQHSGDTYMRNDIRNAIEGVRDMVNDSLPLREETI